MFASDFELDGELKNAILSVFRILAFLHSQDPKQNSSSS